MWEDESLELKSKLDKINAKLDIAILLLNRLNRQESTMAIDLTKITAEVQANTTVTQSVVTLVNSLAAQIAAIPPSSDPTTQAALDQLVQTLGANDQTIAAAVTANTPAK